MSSDRTMCPPASKILDHCVFFDLIAGDVPPGILVFFYNKFWWNHFEGLKIAGDVSPLLSRLRVNTLFNFIDPEMCSPAIAFIILKIPHVVPSPPQPPTSALYRVAAIFPERFQCFTVALKKIFFNNFFRQNRLSCLSKHNYNQTVTFQQRWINRRA